MNKDTQVLALLSTWKMKDENIPIFKITKDHSKWFVKELARIIGPTTSGFENKVNAANI